MDQRRVRSIAGDSAFAVVMVVAGTWFFYDRLETGVGLNLDAREYVAMVNGTEAGDPFRFRVLVPWLASLLPLSPEMSLKVLTCVGLAGCYFVVLRLADRLEVDQRFRWAGLVAAVMSAGHVTTTGTPS